MAARLLRWLALIDTRRDEFFERAFESVVLTCNLGEIRLNLAIAAANLRASA
jgi:hypothetical protein